MPPFFQSTCGKRTAFHLVALLQSLSSISCRASVSSFGLRLLHFLPIRRRLLGFCNLQNFNNAIRRKAFVTSQCCDPIDLKRSAVLFFAHRRRLLHCLLVHTLVYRKIIPSLGIVQLLDSPLNFAGSTLFNSQFQPFKNADQFHHRLAVLSHHFCCKSVFVFKSHYHQSLCTSKGYGGALSFCTRLTFHPWLSFFLLLVPSLTVPMTPAEQWASFFSLKARTCLSATLLEFLSAPSTLAVSIRSRSP